MTVSKQWYFLGIKVINESNTVSLFNGLLDLLLQGHWGLFILLLTFSVIFPLLKIILCFAAWSLPLEKNGRKRIWEILYHTGKWSMLDVFVVAVLVVSVKLGDLVAVKVHSGIFWFTASDIISILLKAKLSKLDHMEFKENTSF